MSWDGLMVLGLLNLWPFPRTSTQQKPLSRMEKAGEKEVFLFHSLLYMLPSPPNHDRSSDTEWRHKDGAHLGLCMLWSALCLLWPVSVLRHFCLILICLWTERLEIYCCFCVPSLYLLALGKLRQKNHKFETRLAYIESSSQNTCTCAYAP